MATNVEARDEIINKARADWKKGMKYKEIAEKYGVSESTIKSWASRYWKKTKSCNQKSKKSQPSKSKKSQPQGAPKGNRNACGNDGGAPLNNNNALKHGGYSSAYWDTLDETEKSIIEDMPQDEETLLIDQIKLYTVRERRILQAIQKVKDSNVEQILSSVSSHETKRRYEGTAEEKAEQKALYMERIKEKIANEERLPGEPYSIFTNTENKQNVISRLEDELTRVQRAKSQAIASLAKLNIEKQKLDFLRGSKAEIEDTDETDELIYGTEN